MTGKKKLTPPKKAQPGEVEALIPSPAWERLKGKKPRAETVHWIEAGPGMPVRPGGPHRAGEGPLFVCEGANLETMAALAKMAGCSVQELQRRRHLNPDSHCPEYAPDGRRRCWNCPYWDRHPEQTPF